MISKIKPIILFITNKDDFAVDYLIYKVKSNNIDYFRINSEDIIELYFSYNVDEIVLYSNNFRVEMDNVKSIYFRRCPNIFPNVTDVENSSYVNRERKEFFEGIYLSLNDRKWINPIYSTLKAERKLYQLKIAQKIGFLIPDTLVSNSPKEINDFYYKHNKDCIVKPISHGLQVTPNGYYSIYTSKLESEFKKQNEIFECPLYIQENIDNFRDIRCTVIGNNIFCVEIEKTNSNDVDWRNPNIKKQYKVHTLPKEIESKILKLHKELNLIYSAIDFILTSDGIYYFLETNPAGEWVWLDNELNLPIKEKIIEELID